MGCWKGSVNEMRYFWQNPVMQLTQSGPRFSYLGNAVWSSKYIDNLPDSAFLIVRKKDVEFKDERGRSHPLDTRSLPIRNHLGNLDCSHLRNAEARANQVEGVTSSVRKAAKKKASRLFDQHCK